MAAMKGGRMAFVLSLAILSFWISNVEAKGAAAAAGDVVVGESTGEKPHRWVLWLLAVVPGVMIAFLVGFCIPFQNTKSSSKFVKQLEELAKVESGTPMPSNPIGGVWNGSYIGARDKNAKFPKGAQWDIQFEDGTVSGSGRDDRGSFVICGYTDPEKATWVQFYSPSKFTKADNPRDSINDCLALEQSRGCFGKAFESGVYQQICSVAFGAGGKRFVRGTVISNSGYEGTVLGQLSPSALEAVV